MASTSVKASSPLRKLRSVMASATNAFYSALIRLKYSAVHSPGNASSDSNSLLLVRTDGIGDFVLFTPALKHIRRIFDGYRISIIVNQVVADLARTCPYLDEVIACDMTRYRWGFAYRLKTIRGLRTGNFDTAIYPAFSQEPLAQELTYCSGAKETVVTDGDLNNITASLKKKNEKYFSRRLKVPSHILPELESNRIVVEMLTGQRIEPSSFLPELWLTESDRLSAGRILAAEGLKPESELIVGLSVGASWNGKQWPAERFVQTARKMMVTYAAQVIVVGSPKDASFASSVCSDIGPGGHVLVGKTTLRELAGVFEVCDLLIANDSGPLHIAVAVGTPTLAIMGGGHFGRFYPYGDLNRHRMVFQKMDCYQCNWQCIYETTRCIQEISVGDVWRAAQQMMEEMVLPARVAHTRGSLVGRGFGK
jgi:ADP-heptose:LPS heptosyltransferase